MRLEQADLQQIAAALGDVLAAKLQPARGAKRGRRKRPRLALRPVEAAKAIGISERTLSRLTKAGDVPHVRIGTSVLLYPIPALKSWLEARAAEQRACTAEEEAATRKTG